MLAVCRVFPMGPSQVAANQPALSLAPPPVAGGTAGRGETWLLEAPGGGPAEARARPPRSVVEGLAGPAHGVCTARDAPSGAEGADGPLTLP